MKRSNRLVLLIGVFLAVIAFVLVLVVLQTPATPTGENVVPTTGDVVIAKADIPLSTRIRADQVEKRTLPLAGISAGAFADPSQVIGQVARQPVTAAFAMNGPADRSTLSLLAGKEIRRQTGRILRARRAGPKPRPGSAWTK